MLNKFHKIDVEKSKAIVKSHVEFYEFYKSFIELIVPVLKKFEGKKISRRIKNAIDVVVNENPEFANAIRWITYDKSDHFTNRIELEIRLNDGMFSVTNRDDRRLRFTLTNRYNEEDRFYFDHFEAESACMKNVDRWINEFKENLLSMERTAVKWNNIMDLLDDIEPEMKAFPTESYSSRY